jgi:hypothetical protein
MISLIVKPLKKRCNHFGINTHLNSLVLGNNPICIQSLLLDA